MKGSKYICTGYGLADKLPSIQSEINVNFFQQKGFFVESKRASCFAGKAGSLELSRHATDLEHVIPAQAIHPT